MSPGRRQAIISANAGILVIETLGTNFSEILIKIYIFSIKKMYLKMSSGKWQESEEYVIYVLLPMQVILKSV